MKIDLFETHDAQSWDKIVAMMGIASPFHTWAMLDYSALAGNAENKSFFLKNDQGQYIAICPFLVETTCSDTRVFRSLSTRGAPVAAPLIVRQGDENRARRDLRLMEGTLHELYQECNIAKILYVHRAYTLMKRNSVCFETKGLFDLVSLGYIPTVLQSVIVDLRQPEETLQSELNKYHRRVIRQAKDSGQTVKIFDSATPPEQVQRMFAKFRDVHTNVAGGKARPSASFDAMLRMIGEGKGELFVNIFNEMVISYLYCGHSGGIASGWMQVNIPDNPVGAPRHLLEWEAILHYRHQGLILYDVGVRFLKSQFGYVVDDKLESIGFYKERLGGVLAPEIHYTKYLDRSLMEAEWEIKMQYGINAHLAKASSNANSANM
jgi:hypothetical protein